jgi:hypothetical protein
MMPNNENIVVYTDLLGFSDLVMRNIEEARNLLSRFYNLSQSTKLDGNFDSLELFLFSDFLFVKGNDIADVVNYACTLYRNCLKANENQSGAPLLPRGGIARGTVLTQKRREAPEVTKNFIVSPALVHAVHMEKLIRGQRLLISANEIEEIAHFWNQRFSAITYDQPSIKPSRSFKKYRYQDLLWARDLRKGHHEAKEETSGLMRLAAKLFRENIGNNAEIEHYAETLRICLLSYSSLLEPLQTDRELLDELVEETLIPFPSNIVWLGFLEMVFLSRDFFSFQLNSSVLKFIRFAVLHPIWGNICGTLCLEEHDQLRHRVQELINVNIRIDPEH